MSELKAGAGAGAGSGYYGYGLRHLLRLRHRLQLRHRPGTSARWARTIEPTIRIGCQLKTQDASAPSPPASQLRLVYTFSSKWHGWYVVTLRAVHGPPSGRCSGGEVYRSIRGGDRERAVTHHVMVRMRTTMARMPARMPASCVALLALLRPKLSHAKLRLPRVLHLEHVTRRYHTTMT